MYNEIDNQNFLIKYINQRYKHRIPSLSHYSFTMKSIRPHDASLRSVRTNNSVKLYIRENRYVVKNTQGARQNDKLYIRSASQAKGSLAPSAVLLVFAGVISNIYIYIYMAASLLAFLFTLAIHINMKRSPRRAHIDLIYHQPADTCGICVLCFAKALYICTHAQPFDPTEMMCSMCTACSNAFTPDTIDAYSPHYTKAYMRGVDHRVQVCTAGIWLSTNI